MDLSVFEDIAKVDSQEAALRQQTVVGRLHRVALVLWNVTVANTFEPEDTFYTKMRKFVFFLLVAANAVCCVMPYFFYRAAQLHGRTPKTSLDAQRETTFWIFGATYSLFFVSTILFYIYVRVTRTTPDWLTTVAFATTIVTVGIISLGAPFYPLDATLTACCIGAALANTPHMWLIITIVAGFLIVQIINDTFGNVLMIPGYYDQSIQTWGDVLFVRSCGIFCVFLAFLGVIGQLALAKRNMIKAERAALLSRRVSDLLAQYNTAACRREIAAYLTLDDADATLAEVSLALVANLERYRPFLPNYVLAANGSDEDDDLLDRPAAKTTASGQRQSSVAATAAPSSDNGSTTESDARGAVPSEKLSSSPRQHPQVGQSFDCGNNSVRSNHSASGHRADEYAGPSGPAAVVSVGLSSWHRSVVSFCTMRIGLAASVPFSVATAALQHQLVGVLHEKSSATGAALHAFVGDTLTATWNATRRVAMGETKACRFMLAVRDALQAAADLRVAFRAAGAVVTGPAHSLFAGDDRLRLFTVCLDEPAATNAGLSLRTARGITGLVMDSVTRDAARYHMAAVPVDVVTAPGSGPAAPTTATVLFALLHDKAAVTANPRALLKAGGGDAEWMYEMEQHEASEQATDAWLNSWTPKLRQVGFVVPGGVSPRLVPHSPIVLEDAVTSTPKGASDVVSESRKSLVDAFWPPITSDALEAATALTTHSSGDGSEAYQHVLQRNVLAFHASDFSRHTK